MLHLFSFRRFALIWLVLAFAFVLSACSLADEPEPAGPVQVGPLPGQESKLAPAALPDITSGGQIFAEHCTGCHGVKGAGNGPQSEVINQQGGHVPDFTDPAFARASSPLAWFGVITNGNMAKLMPPWSQSLTDQQRWDVAYYVTTFGAPKDAPDAGKAAYTANCESCHAADGSQNGLTDGAKMAALSPQDIYDQYITSGTDGVHTFGDQIDEATRWSVVAYARSFSYGAAAPAATLTPTLAPTTEPTVPPTAIPTLEGTPGTPAPAPTEGGPAPATGGPAPTEATVAPTATATPLAGVGSVSGKVSNGTAGGPVPPDLSVTLSGLELDSTGKVSEFVSKQSPIATDGTYRFDDLPFDKGKSAYVVTVTYNGLQFENFQQVDPTQLSIDLPVTIYELTTDPSVVSMDAVHYFFTAHQNSLLVVQVMIFSNGGDKAYVSSSRLPTGQAAGVAFSLPADATSIGFDTGELGTRFLPSGDLIYDTQPLLPGQASDTISATYIVPYNNDREFSFPVQYPTRLVNVLTPPEMALSGGSFIKGTDKAFQGQTLSTYTMQNPPAGETLTFHVGTSLQPLDILRIVLAALLVILIVGAIVYWLMRRKAMLAAPALAVGGEGSEALLRQIASLDESFREGRVNRLDYEARRAELKALLAEQMQGDE